jgi:DNA-binding transcriptional MerR regulator
MRRTVISTDEELPPLLTPSETAKLLRRSTRTLRRLASIGVLHPVRIAGGRPLYRTRDVLALIDNAA